jgi:hypothetical protein
VAGSHIFRAEVVCHSPQAKLAAEETTLFYGEESAEKPTKLRDGEPADQLQPVESR